MNKKEQKDIFNIFHDGSFQNFCSVGKDLEFDVDIEYLAQVVNPHYTFFKGRMKNCRQLVLDIWDVEETEDIATINDFADDLEILCADIDPKGNVRVVCNGFSRCPGAFLYVQCEALLIFDESGRAMTMAELTSACRQYWDSFRRV